jgi:homoserine O-acetyltransferase/O-succinyltransferase
MPAVTLTCKIFSPENPFVFESGVRLPSVTVAYETNGKLNADKSNVILICHALTGNAHAWGAEDDPGWWQGIIGPGKSIDTDRYFVVCSNFLGGCYGTTGPTTINPETGRIWGARFPRVSVRDIVRVEHELLTHLGIQRIAAVIGGSLGGMQALEWGVMYPDFVRGIIPIGCGIRHAPWAIAWNEIARQSILNDPEWLNGEYTAQPARGLALARMIAMISYRSAPSFELKFGRTVQQPGDSDLFAVESYLRYQGEKLVGRFDAATYVSITRAMDSHDIERDRGPAATLLHDSPVRCLAIGIDTDVLYPIAEQKQLAGFFPHGRYAELHSPHGHDAFLIEFEQLNPLVHSFLTTL